MILREADFSAFQINRATRQAISRRWRYSFAWPRQLRLLRRQPLRTRASATRPVIRLRAGATFRPQRLRRSCSLRVFREHHIFEGRPGEVGSICGQCAPRNPPTHSRDSIISSVAADEGDLHCRRLGRWQRFAELINKSNQFNLTTRRYTEADILALAADAETLTFRCGSSIVSGTTA